jgi:hypothetical protein
MVWFDGAMTAEAKFERQETACFASIALRCIQPQQGKQSIDVI